MATLSFTASNGKRYSLLALPNKLTSPSLKVGSSYVPCFSGNTESEVTSGEYIYTLSPMKVGGTRAAYKRRLSFGATGHVYIELAIGAVWTAMDGVVYAIYNGYINRVYTNMAGYTAHVNISSTNQGVHPVVIPFFFVPYDFYWNGTYTVTHDASGSTVASGQFSVGATANASVAGFPNWEYPTFTIK